MAMSINAPAALRRLSAGRSHNQYRPAKQPGLGAEQSGDRQQHEHRGSASTGPRLQRGGPDHERRVGEVQVSERPVERDRLTCGDQGDRDQAGPRTEEGGSEEPGGIEHRAQREVSDHMPGRLGGLPER